MPIYAYKNEWKKCILNLGLCSVVSQFTPSKCWCFCCCSFYL